MRSSFRNRSRMLRGFASPVGTSKNVRPATGSATAARSLGRFKTCPERSDMHRHLPEAPSPRYPLHKRAADDGSWHFTEFSYVPVTTDTIRLTQTQRSERAEDGDCTRLLTGLRECCYEQFESRGDGECRSASDERSEDDKGDLVVEEPGSETECTHASHACNEHVF
jgi:hypothetical protein